MTDPNPPDLFRPDHLQAWAARADADAFVRRQRTLADLTLSLRTRDTSACAWLHIGTDSVRAGQGQPPHGPAAFWLEGEPDAFTDLTRGVPFNRLVRQHRLVLGGDLRNAVQNWLLLYAITRLINDQES